MHFLHFKSGWSWEEKGREVRVFYLPLAFTSFGQSLLNSLFFHFDSIRLALHPCPAAREHSGNRPLIISEEFVYTWVEGVRSSWSRGRLTHWSIYLIKALWWQWQVQHMFDGLIEQRGIHIFCWRDKQVCTKGPSQDIKKKEKYKKQVSCFSRVHFCLGLFLAAVLLFTILTSGTLGIRWDRWMHWISQPVISFWLLRQTAVTHFQREATAGEKENGQFRAIPMCTLTKAGQSCLT